MLEYMDTPEPKEGKGCVKNTLIVISVIFLIMGLGIAGLGVYATQQDFVYLTGQTVPALIICLGGGIFLIAFLGCCGGIRRSKFLLSLYVIFIGLFILAEGAIVILLFFYRNQTQDYLQGLWSAAKNDAIEQVQNKLACCGFSVATNCSANSTEPCLNVLKTIIKNNYAILGGILIGLLFLELLGFIFALCVACSSKRVTDLWGDF